MYSLTFWSLYIKVAGLTTSHLQHNAGFTVS